jgi:hypothetical protein
VSDAQGDPAVVLDLYGVVRWPTVSLRQLTASWSLPSPSTLSPATWQIHGHQGESHGTQED